MKNKKKTKTNFLKTLSIFIFIFLLIKIAVKFIIEHVIKNQDGVEHDLQEEEDVELTEGDNLED